MARKTKQHVQRHRGEEQPRPFMLSRKLFSLVFYRYQAWGAGVASDESGDGDLVALKAELRSLGFSWRQKQSLKNVKQKCCCDGICVSETSPW